MKIEIFLNFIFTFIVSFISFLQNKYFIKYMGIESLGMIKLFSQLLAYLNIIELGLGSASAFALYKPLSEKNYEKLSIIVNTIEKIYMKIGFILIGLGILVIPFLDFFIDTSNFKQNIYFFWVLYVVNTAITYFFIKYVILFTANQEYIYVKTVQTLSILIFKILQIYFIIKVHSFLVYIGLMILDNLCQWIFFYKHYKLKYHYIIKVKEKYNALKNDIKNLFWHKIGSLVVFNTDLILISKFTNLKIVGIYASYKMIFQVLSTMVNVIINVLSPKIGNYIVENSKREIYLTFKKFNIFFVFISIFLTYCSYKLINPFMELWLGKTFIFRSFTLKLLCFNLFIDLFRWNLEIFKNGAGFFSDIKSPIFESLINLVVSIVLGMYIGLDGIIIGTIFSNIIIILIYKPILVYKKCFNENFVSYLKDYIKYLGLSGASIFVCNMALKFIPLCIIISSWFNWITRAVITSVISLSIIFLFFLIDADFRNIIICSKKKIV